MSDVRRTMRGETLVWFVTIPVVIGIGVIAYLESNASSFAAYLALLGVALTGAVSRVVARQSDKRLELEHVDDRERLRLDAAMRAGELLSPNKEMTNTPAAAAAGLLALTQLNQTELAVALLVDLWSPRDGTSHEVSSETAILVIDRALRAHKECPNASLVAAELLCRNACWLDAAQSLHWPSGIDGSWLPALFPRTKLLIVDALVLATTTSPPQETALRALAARLLGISENDPDPAVQGCTGSLIHSIMPALQRFGAKEIVHGEICFTMADLERAESRRKEHEDSYMARLAADRSEALASWSAECQFSTQSGALGGSSCEWSGGPDVPSNNGTNKPMASTNTANRT